MGRSFDFRMLSLRVGKLLLQERRRRLWNYEVSRRLNAKRSCTHETLRRFESEGWVSSYMEQDPVGRSPRVFYQLTDAGIAAFNEALGCLQLLST